MKEEPLERLDCVVELHAGHVEQQDSLPDLRPDVDDARQDLRILLVRLSLLLL